MHAISLKLGRYYTPAWAAEQLIARVDVAPTSVLDLCCGEGALAKAAAQRWTISELLTVDIDPSIRDAPFSSLARHHQHLIGDALGHSLHALTDRSQSFDLVLCNPPFGRYTLGEAGVGGRFDLLPPGCVPTAEMLGLAQALQMVRQGGIVAAILPDTVMTGQRAAYFRKRLLERHSVLIVAELPIRTFSRTDAKAYLTIIRSGDRSERVQVERLDRNGTISGSAQLDLSGAIVRLSLPASEPYAERGNESTLSSLQVSIKRGRLSAAIARASGTPHFHTSHFAQAHNGVIHFDGIPAHVEAVHAEEGDILIARVHRSLHEKVALVESGRRPITDCVYRLRCSDAHRERVWESLRSPAGRNRLAAAARGVGPKHLPLRDLTALVV